MSTQSNAPTAGPLDGVRVLDLSRILAGPTCTQLLGDLGADIIKIEKPQSGDDTRQWGPPFVQDAHGHNTNESAYYLSSNRNKRSVAIDITSPEGTDKIKKLAAHCDILIENFKVGGLAKYGLGYDDLKQQCPKLVYCSISGFGQTGPNAKLPGYDIMAQGYSGIMSITGEPDGEPIKVGVGIADVMCGMYASTAVLAALRHRDQTGEGQHIDVALVDTNIAWLVNEGTNYLTSKKKPQRRGNQHPNIVPYQIFATRDGHVIIAVGNDAQYQRFCEVIGQPALAADARFATNALRLGNRDALVGLLAERLLTFDSASLLDELKKNGVPAGPVNTLDEVFSSDQVAAREMKINIPHPLAASGGVDLIGNPLKFSKTPVTYRRAPPVLGADTDEVLNELLNESLNKQDK